MKAYKEGKFLIFKMEEVDEYAGDKAKFDLSTGDFISPTGKKVKTLNKYLKGYELDSMIDCFEDERYKKYLLFIKDMVEYHDNIKKATINNVLLGAKKYMEFEKFYIYGVEVDYRSCSIYEYIPYTQEEIEEYEKKHNTKLYYAPTHNIKKYLKFKDVPKIILEFCKENKIKLNYKFAKYKNKIIHVIDQVKNISDKNYSLLFFAILIEGDRLFNLDLVGDNGISNYIRTHSFYREKALLDNYKYDYNKLVEHIKYLILIEHVGSINEDWIEQIGTRGGRGPAEIMDQLYDYNMMQEELYGNEKYDKYPKNFLTTKNIVTYKYNSLIRKRREEKLSKNIYRKDLEWEDSGFKFISPKTCKDIVTEGQNMHNCVAGYIDRVLNNNCIIMFMRPENSPNESYITLELDYRYSVVQYKRSYNRSLSINECQILDKYKKFLANAYRLKNDEIAIGETDIKDLELEIERRV